MSENPRDNYELWKAHLRIAIMGATIARECHDMMARGLGAPEVEDMQRFTMEAGALADLWEESVPA